MSGTPKPPPKTATRETETLVSAGSAALTVEIGGQLLVFRGDDDYAPYCTAADRGRVRRCGASLSRLDYAGWGQVYITGTDGFITILATGAIGDECWIRQRCPSHLNSDQALLAPEWTVFDPAADADLISQNSPLWMPQGIQRPRRRVGLLATSNDLADVIAQALATRVEPAAKTALYRWFDEKDLLLYVGITDDLLERSQSHILESAWMDYAVRSTITRYPTRKEAADAETAAIKAEHPLFNKVHNGAPEAHTRLIEFLAEHDVRVTLT